MYRAQLTSVIQCTVLMREVELRYEITWIPPLTDIQEPGKYSHFSLRRALFTHYPALLFRRNISGRCPAPRHSKPYP
ncbi:hypothetical protein LENED_010943 [Lentinula edodes]|uniref:Uncharacterized protein n=1 Tax=Lentinula edodes TaxID=5353 RepID=A0A1Q3ENQ5_LENED|nr:hypothetical protein LENED_010943 [Lentinula edodes]